MEICLGNEIFMFYVFVFVVMKHLTCIKSTSLKL